MPGTPDGQRAHDVLLSFEPLGYNGACWYYVWQAYAAAGAWTNQGSTPTAYAAWNATWGKHPGDRNPPPGAAIWLGRRYDGNLDGDVFIAGQYDGDHAATDQTYYGVTGITSLQARIDLCGREYLGWSDHVLDCPIALGGQTPPPDPEPPTPEWIDDMDYYAKGSDDTSGRIWLVDVVAKTKRQLTPSEWATAQGAYTAMGQKVPLSTPTSAQLGAYVNVTAPPPPSTSSFSATEHVRLWAGLAIAGLIAVGGLIVAILAAAGVLPA